MKKYFFRLLVVPVLLLGAYVAEPLYVPWITPSGFMYLAGQKVYWHGNPHVKKVALTFDDGPSLYTEQILDILRKHNVRATFFLMGSRVEQFPEIARRITVEGHSLGNHTYNHAGLFFKTKRGTEREILRGEKAIEQATGIKPVLFRPPHGVDNLLTYQVTKKLGYTVVKYSVSSKDWTRPGSQKILGRIKREGHNGSIILLHDGSPLHENPDRSQTVSALPEIISELQSQGYELVTVPELLELPQN